MTRQDEFVRIYDTDEWRGAGETRSGAGSTMRATKELRVTLPKLLHRLGVTSILDAGCGDANWLPDYEGIDYVGIDIVPEAVAECKRRHPGLDFRTRDIVVDELPPTDTILCREVLMHLSADEVGAALDNFWRSGARLLIATTFPNEKNAASDPWVGRTWNQTGGFSTWNLEVAPFELGPPQETLLDPGWWWKDRRGRWCQVETFDPNAPGLKMTPVPVTQVLGVWNLG